MSDVDDDLLLLAGGASSDEEEGEAQSPSRSPTPERKTSRGKKSSGRSVNRRRNDSEEEGEA